MGNKGKFVNYKNYNVDVIVQYRDVLCGLTQFQKEYLRYFSFVETVKRKFVETRRRMQIELMIGLFNAINE